MNNVDRLIELASKHGCEFMNANCDVCVEMAVLMNNLNYAEKISNIVNKKIKELRKGPQYMYDTPNQWWIDFLKNIKKEARKK